MTGTATRRAVLERSRTIAVVGLSPKSWRESYGVSRAMQAAGWQIVPVNPAAGVAHILDEPVFATLTEAARHQPIDLVNVFRNPEDVPAVVQEAIAIGAKGVWLQLGITHPEAAATAEAAGLTVVQDACIAVEMRRSGARPPG
jgi:predicted CoA-binding protein